MSSDKKFKLTYFNAKARGELSRYLFALAGVPFEDHRIEFADWPAIKDKTPLGTVLNQPSLAFFLARFTLF
jgi:hypothetical protein